MPEDKTKEARMQELKNYIDTIKTNLERAQKELSILTGESFNNDDNGEIVEGFFDGQNMIGPEGKVFSVPANYASKSKLIEGDRLKLTIMSDGSFIYKQIGPAARKKLIGSLVLEDNSYKVNAEGKKYNLIYASVTYYKANPGDRISVIVPTSTDSTWAAIDNVISSTVSDPKAAENFIDEPGLQFQQQMAPKLMDAVTAPANNGMAPNSVINEELKSENL